VGLTGAPLVLLGPSAGQSASLGPPGARQPIGLPNYNEGELIICDRRHWMDINDIIKIYSNVIRYTNKFKEI
jgi:hypothetical protein